MVILQSAFLFVVAGLCEIGGGWLLWKWLRHGWSAWWGLVGGCVLVLYGVVATLQAAHFSRVYAVYGGVFIAMSLLWGWRVDGTRPDRPDLVGAAVAVLGVAVMMYWPRGAAIPAP